MERDNEYKYDKLPTEPDAAKKKWKEYIEELFDRNLKKFPLQRQIMKSGNSGKDL